MRGGQGQVGEGRGRVREEHDTEPTRDRVDVVGLERVDLRVRLDELDDGGEAFLVDSGCREVEQRARDVAAGDEALAIEESRRSAV